MSEQPTTTDPAPEVSTTIPAEIPDAEASTNPVPNVGVLLGLDYGTRRIGVAMSTTEQRMSLPLETYERRTDALDREWLRKLARGYRAVGLVVGLPVHMSGQEGEKAREARAFGAWAAETTGLPVAYWDERYSSSAADHFLMETNYSRKNKTQRRDQLAAHVILTSFLDAADRSAAPSEFAPNTSPVESLERQRLLAKR